MRYKNPFIWVDDRFKNDACISNTPKAIEIPVYSPNGDAMAGFHSHYLKLFRSTTIPNRSPSPRRTTTLRFLSEVIEKLRVHEWANKLMFPLSLGGYPADQKRRGTITWVEALLRKGLQTARTLMTPLPHAPLFKRMIHENAFAGANEK